MSKTQKIDENRYYWRAESLYLLNDLSIFNEIFEKNVSDNTIKSKKAGLHPLFGKRNLGKTTWVD